MSELASFRTTERDAVILVRPGGVDLFVVDSGDELLGSIAILEGVNEAADLLGQFENSRSVVMGSSIHGTTDSAHNT